MTMTLPQFRVSGSPEEMGHQYGELCRDLIQDFVKQRVTAVDEHLRERGHNGTDRLFEVGEQCLEKLKAFDRDGYHEHLAIADGAGVDPIRLYTVANMTDIRDIITLPGEVPDAEDEGCTSALVPPSISANGHSLQGQTWDLNGPDMKYVIALHQLPDDGPETWTVTCAGCQTLMGMNEHGVTVGTTNLKTRGARVGIPYLSVLHLALKQASLAEASAVVENAPVTGSHSYWIGDKNRAVEWERTPMAAYQRSTETGAQVRSNHCLFDENKRLETDLSESTHARFDRMQGFLAQSEQHTLDGLITMFSDRSDGRLSINRFAEDNSGATTNAVVAMNPAELEFLACRGQADRGVWAKLEFERGTPSA
ncbi:MAG: C45 family peptidase [Pseudomonadota bacterium]